MAQTNWAILLIMLWFKESKYEAMYGIIPLLMSDTKKEEIIPKGKENNKLIS